MGFTVVKLAVVTSRKFITDFAQIPKLELVTTVMLDIEYVVMLI